MWRPSVAQALAWLASLAIPPAPDARTATRASRALNARRRKLRRQALIEHLASFGPAGERGLQILKEGTPNV